MEFRNHQAKITHRIHAIRAQPLGLLLLLILAPLAIFAALAVLGLVVVTVLGFFIFRAVGNLFGGKPAGYPRRQTDATTIDVEVVRKESVSRDGAGER